MGKNRLRYFRRVERRNNDDVLKKIYKLSVENNRPKKKQMEGIREDIKAYRIHEDIVRDKKGWRGKLRVAVYACNIKEK